MKSLNKQAFRAEVSEREEHNCKGCGERFHDFDLKPFDDRYESLTYTSLVCDECYEVNHGFLEIKRETETILKNAANGI